MTSDPLEKRRFMRRTLQVTAVALAVVVVLAPRLGPAAEQDLERDALVRSCLDHINHERYDDALRCANELRTAFAASPAGPFVAATAYQTRMSDYRVRRFEREFEREIADAIALSERATREDPSAESRFLWGAAEGYRCVYWFRQGKWLKAVRAALRGMSLLKQARRGAPGFADPLMGLALYSHAKSKVHVLGLGLFGDHPAEVQQQLLEATEKARFVAVNALYAQQYVLVDRGEYARALPVNDRLFAEFPTNPVCLYNRALILESLGRPLDAAPLWRRLVDVIYAFSPPSQGFLAECHLHLALIARQTNEAGEAARLLSRAKAHAASRHPAEELDGPYSSFDDVRETILRTQKEWARDAARAR
jgi:tetratricopeptide (TPR) repeat protein